MTRTHEELYSYLEAFESLGVVEILNYLSEMPQDAFEVFSEGLAQVLPFDSFENDSLFNFRVDSTLAGSPFPCRALKCRENYVHSLARFSALYADRVLIPSPIDNAYTAHEDEVDLEELAFAIYITMRLKDLVMAGIVGFSSDYQALCRNCYNSFIDSKKELSKRVTSLWPRIESSFINSTTCILEFYEDGTPFVRIQGMDAYGSHEEIDVDFSVVPPILHEKHDRVRNGERTILDERTIRKSGLLALLAPLYTDTIHALADVQPYWNTYLSTRPAQLELMNDIDANPFSVNDGNNHLFMNPDVNFPIPDNVSVTELLKYRAHNEESFKWCRDEINKNIIGKSIDENTLKSLKLEIINPALNEIDSRMKNDQKRLTLTAGTELIMGAAAISLGQFMGLSIGDIATIATLMGAGHLVGKGIQVAAREAARNHPFYFLWQLNQKSRFI